MRKGVLAGKFAWTEVHATWGETHIHGLSPLTWFAKLARAGKDGKIIIRVASPFERTWEMAQKTPKTAVVAFKVEEELADFLNQLPNKSAFIRKAIAAQMSMACPLCHGSGQATRSGPRSFCAADE